MKRRNDRLIDSWENDGIYFNRYIDEVTRQVVKRFNNRKVANIQGRRI